MLPKCGVPLRELCINDNTSTLCITDNTSTLCITLCLLSIYNKHEAGHRLTAQGDCGICGGGDEGRLVADAVRILNDVMPVVLAPNKKK